MERTIRVFLAIAGRLERTDNPIVYVYDNAVRSADEAASTSSNAHVRVFT
jgi:hypothetical protein